MLVPRPLNCRSSDAVSTHVAVRNDGASVSGAYWAYEVSEALSSSFTLRHRAWMQANAVSQRAAWVLVPRPLNYRLSDALWTRVAPRNGGVSVSGVVVVYEASGTLGSSFVLRHHAWMLANAVSQGASSVGAGAAVAELPLEGCCIDACCAQKWRRICFGGSWGACSVWDT